MNEQESTAHLATSVFRQLEKLERSTRLHGTRAATKLRQSILSDKAKFQSTFGAPPTSSRVNRGKSLQLIYESDPIPGEHLLEDDIEAKLGQYYLRLRASIQDAKVLLDEIIMVFEKLAGGKIGAELALEIPPGPDSTRQGQTDTQTDGLVPRNPRSAGNLQAHKLEWLLCRLREHINDAIRFQKSAPWPTAAPSYTERQEGNWWIGWLFAIPAAMLNLFTSLIARCYSKQSGLQPLTISAVQPAPAPVVNPPLKKLKAGTHRAPLTDLYTVLSHKLKCGCHFVHLGLCSTPVSPSESGFPSSGLENPALICSLFVTLDLRTSMDSYVFEDPLYLKVLRHKSSNESATHSISTPPQSPTRPLTSCSTIITSPVGSRHCLRCEAPAQTEFMVHSARPPVCCPPANTPSSSPTYNPILTLRDILTSDPQEGNTIKLQDEDRLLLADKFVGWVTQYYDTPWLRDLDTHKIRFFTRYEKDPKYANWTPYISTSFKSASPECRKYNNGLRALGLVLLQLGLNKLPDYFRDDDWTQIIAIASTDLPSTLGARYTSIVKKLLTEGEKGDRIEGKQIDDLAREIRPIIDRTLYFLS